MNRRIIEINNESGHYQTNGRHVMRVVQRVFHHFGYTEVMSAYGSSALIRIPPPPRPPLPRFSDLLHDEESENTSIAIDASVLLPPMFITGSPTQEGRNLLANLEHHMQLNWLSQDDIAVAMNMRKFHFKMKIDAIKQGNPPSPNLIRQMATAIGCSREALLAAPVTVITLPEKNQIFIAEMSRLGWSIDKVSAETGITTQRLRQVIHQGVDGFTKEELAELIKLKGVHIHQFIPVIRNDIDILQVISAHLKDIPDEPDIVYMRQALERLRHEKGLKIGELSHTVGMHPAEFNAHIMGRRRNHVFVSTPLAAHLQDKWRLTLRALGATGYSEADLVLMGRFNLTSSKLEVLKNYGKIIKEHVHENKSLAKFLKKKTELDRYKIFMEVEYQTQATPQKPWNEVSSRSVVREVKRSKVKMTTTHVSHLSLNIERQIQDQWLSLSNLSVKTNIQTTELNRQLKRLKSGKIPSHHFIKTMANALGCAPSQLFSTPVEGDILPGAKTLIHEAKMRGLTRGQLAVTGISEERLYRVIHLGRGKFNTQEIVKLNKAGISLPTLACFAKRDVNILSMAKIFADNIDQMSGYGHSFDSAWTIECYSKGIARFVYENKIDINTLCARTGFSERTILRVLTSPTSPVAFSDLYEIIDVLHTTRHDILLMGKFSLSVEQLQELKNYESFLEGYTRGDRKQHRKFLASMSDAERVQLYIGMKHRASLLADGICTHEAMNDVINTIRPKPPVERPLTKQETKNFVINIKHQSSDQWMGEFELTHRVASYELEREGLPLDRVEFRRTKLTQKIALIKRGRLTKISFVADFAKALGCSTSKLLTTPKKVAASRVTTTFLKDAIQHDVSLKECAKVLNRSEKSLHRAINLARGGLKAHEIEFLLDNGMKLHTLAPFAASNVDMISRAHTLTNGYKGNIFGRFVKVNDLTVEMVSQALNIPKVEALDQFFSFNSHRVHTPLGQYVYTHEAPRLRSEWHPLFLWLTQENPVKHWRNVVTLSDEASSDLKQCQNLLKHYVNEGIITAKRANRILDSESNSYKFLVGLKHGLATTIEGVVDLTTVRRLIARVIKSRTGFITTLFVGSMVKTVPLTASEIVADYGVHYYDDRALALAARDPVNSAASKMNSHLLKWLFLLPRAVGEAVMTPFEPGRSWSLSSIFYLPNDVIRNFLNAGGYSQAIANELYQGYQVIKRMFQASSGALPHTPLLLNTPWSSTNLMTQSNSTMGDELRATPYTIVSSTYQPTLLQAIPEPLSSPTTMMTSTPLLTAPTDTTQNNSTVGDGLWQIPYTSLSSTFHSSLIPHTPPPLLQIPSIRAPLEAATEPMSEWLVDPWAAPSRATRLLSQPTPRPTHVATSLVSDTHQQLQRQNSLLITHYLNQTDNPPSYLRNTLFATNHQSPSFFHQQSPWRAESHGSTAISTWLQPNQVSFAQSYNPFSSLLLSSSIWSKYRYPSYEVLRAARRSLEDQWYKDGNFGDAYYQTRSRLGILNFYFSEFVSVLRSAGLVSTYNTVHPWHRVRDLCNHRGEIGGIAAKIGLIEGLKNSVDEVLTQHPIFCIESEGDIRPFKDEELEQLLREVPRLITTPTANPFVSIHFDSDGSQYIALDSKLQETHVGETLWILDYFMKCYANGGTYPVDILLHWHKHKNLTTRTKIISY